ncbi:MAG: 3-dehydroquinate synthase [Bacteroidota bacterium]|nr:3-dehydroquinate synthase [Bacteroidota bacterium]
MKQLTQAFQVEYKYNVFFTETLFQEQNPILFNFFNGFGQKNYRKKILFLIDEQVINCHDYLKSDIPNYFSKNHCVELIPELLILPGGEVAKNDNHTEKIVEAIHQHGIDRHSFVAAIGGGAILDLVGYAAAISHRGVKHIRIPTTVLSQNDSGVGVKNGINFKGKKNFIGTFSPPVAVFNDYKFLETLEYRDWRSGMAEAVKVALIKDADFFEWIEINSTLLIQKNKKAMQYLIYRCAELHLQHISGGDPFEIGSSRPLDFGHWLAHKLEYLSGFSIRHGEAVAVGIAVDSVYSNLIGILPKKELDRIINLLLKLGFDLFHPTLIEKDKINILNGLNEFREHLGGQLTIMLLEGIGKGKEVNEMNFELLKNAIDRIQEWKIMQPDNHNQRLLSAFPATTFGINQKFQ